MTALTPAGGLAASCPGWFDSLRSPLRGCSFVAVYLRCAPVPVFTPPPFPDILPPTTPTSPHTASACSRMGLLPPAAGLRPSPAGSSVCCGRIVFTFVAVCQVLFVAPHPASRRRSYFKFSAGLRSRPAGVSHSRGVWRFTAHWCGCLSRIGKTLHTSRCG